MKRYFAFFMVFLINLVASAQVVENTLSIPNAFLPQSDDATKNTFKPTGTNLAACIISVYDKWGTEIWSSNEVENGEFVGFWDGKQNGNYVKTDSYIWKMEASFLDGEVWEGFDVGNGKKAKYGSVAVIIQSSSDTQNIQQPDSIPATLQSITIQDPKKLNYYVGEILDTLGLMVTANYSDGKSIEVFDYIISGFNSQKEGECIVTVSYKNFSETFTASIRVRNDDITLTTIADVQTSLNVKVLNGQILVNGEAPAFVVTVAGQKIANANLKAGVYFVVADGNSVSVVVQ